MRRLFVGQEEQEIDVRERRQLAPAVAAEGDHGDLILADGQARRTFRRRDPAGPADHHVDEIAARRRHLTPRSPEPVADPEPLGLRLEEPAECGRRLRRRRVGIDGRAGTVRGTHGVLERKFHGDPTRQSPCLRVAAPPIPRGAGVHRQRVAHSLVTIRAPRARSRKATFPSNFGDGDPHSLGPATSRAWRTLGNPFVRARRPV